MSLPFEPKDLSWMRSKTYPDLLPDSVHLWRVRLDGVGYQDERLAALLSPEEQERAQRFLFGPHRQRFIRTHGIYRMILSKYSGIDPARITFGVGARGKPFLVPAPNRLRFNLSHSGDLMILGIAIDLELGVDVEVINHQLNWTQIAGNYFNDYEMAEIGRLPSKIEQLRAFYRVWTLKEAYLKARGDGLPGGLDQVVVNLESETQGLFLAFPGGENEKHRWQAISFRPATGACGAVVAQQGHLPMKVIQYDWMEE
jgi:4'-phosphopantetheinyl transferase